MDCEKYFELMSAALDNELTAEERRDLDSHLAVCPDCAELFRTLSENAKAMRELDCEVPANLKQRIMDNLPQQEKPARQGKVIHWKRWAPVAAAACLAVVIALVPKSDMSMNSAEAPQAYAPTADAPRTPEAAPGMQPMPSMDTESYVSDSASTAYGGELEMGGLVDPAEPSAQEPQPDGSTEPEAPPAEAPTSTESAEPNHYSFENQRSIRVDYGSTPAPGAQIIGSVESLEKYLARFSSLTFDGQGNSIPIAELESLRETYTDIFFQTHRLLCVVVESGSGSNRYEIAPQGLYRHSIDVIEEVPEVGTCDMAAWLLTAEVDTMFDDGDILDVRFTR